MRRFSGVVFVVFLFAFSGTAAEAKRNCCKPAKCCKKAKASCCAQAASCCAPQPTCCTPAVSCCGPAGSGNMPSSAPAPAPAVKPYEEVPAPGPK